MATNIIDEVVRQISIDLSYHDTTSLEEFLKHLYTKKTHDIFVAYLPEELHEKFKDYEDIE